MTPQTTALVLIGFQDDYFGAQGILADFLEDRPGRDAALANTVAVLDGVAGRGVTVVETPICFTPDYAELGEPTGILAAIRDVGAFQAGAGARRIGALDRFDAQVLTVPGKRGLNAFSDTDLDATLRERGVTDVVLAGAVTSICIDSTGRSAFEKGYRVHVLSDCTTGRTAFEQSFYCEQVFPLYARVIDHRDLLEALSP